MFKEFVNVKDTSKFEEIPHGSGIDYTWKIVDRGGYYICNNSFHCMDQNGMYNGIANFSLVIPKKNPQEFRLHFRGSSSRYLNRKHLLREYLEDILGYWISETF